jgi:hypothetical protein
MLRLLQHDRSCHGKAISGAVLKYVAIVVVRLLSLLLNMNLYADGEADNRHPTEAISRNSTFAITR